MQEATYDLPIKGDNAIEILKSDHALIKSMLETLTSAVDVGERKNALERLKAALTIHNATEENLVYPAIERIANDKGEAELLYHETAEADIAVFELDSLLNEGRGEEDTFAIAAEKLRSAVHKHMDEEEEKAFKELSEAADPNQAELLTRSVRQFRGAIHLERTA
jgi:hemerythrin-like domain-containing protein